MRVRWWPLSALVATVLTLGGCSDEKAQQEGLIQVVEGEIDVSLSSTLANAATAAETYATDQGGSYDGLTVAALVTYGYTSTAEATITRVQARGDSFCIEAVAERGGESAHYSGDSGQPETGPCP